MLQCERVAIQAKTEGVARGLNIATYDRVIGVGIGPVVHCDAGWWLTRDDDVVRRAAKIADVVADPFNGEALVEEADILRCVRRAGEAKDVDAEVKGYYYDVFGIGEICAIVEGCVWGADGESFELDVSCIW